ncbi:MAG: MFS transporter [Nitriliruptoraceae bacterium]|nr:MFS transporter [Nitriliruptoraceae bacterium]
MEPTRLFSRQYSLVAAATFLFFTAFGASLPVLPRYVVDVLGHGDAAVGIVFAVYAAAAVVVRPWIGRVGDRSGRRILVLGGAALTGLALLGHLAATSLELLVLMRVLAGAGQAAVVVGFSTLSVDLSPPERQGEGASYVMVALQLGLGFGPVLGELALRVGGYDLVWIASAVGCLVAFAIGAMLPSLPSSRTLTARGLFHPAAIRPGIVLWLGTLGFVGFLAFVPLYAAEIGVAQVGLLFLLCSGTIAIVRTLGAKLPDRLGAVRLGSIGLSFVLAAMLVLGLVPTVAGLVTATLLLGFGAAIVAPSMVVAAVRGVPEGERARVMSTFTMFLDLASAIGPFALGLAAASTGYGPTFVVAGLAAGLGLVLLRVWLAPRLRVAPSGDALPGTVG